MPLGPRAGSRALRLTVAYGEPVGKGGGCAVRHGPRRTWRHRVGWAAPVVVGGAVLLAGCAAGGDGEDAANDLLFSPDPAPTATAPATPTAAPVVAFPDSCSDLVPTPEVVEVVAAPLPGGTTFVYADAQPDIKRTQRITCGYGVPEAAEGQPAPTPADPAVEITLNEYEDAQAAAARVDVTLESAAAEGSQISTIPVGTLEGTVLRRPERATLVVRQDARTLVVTVRRGLVPAAAEDVVLTELAGRALGLPTTGPATTGAATPGPTVTPPPTPLAN